MVNQVGEDGTGVGSMGDGHQSPPDSAASSRSAEPILAPAMDLPAGVTAVFKVHMVEEQQGINVTFTLSNVTAVPTDMAPLIEAAMESANKTVPGNWRLMTHEEVRAELDASA